ncbi:MAG: acetolactate synthase [Phycisphaerae bacterium]
MADPRQTRYNYGVQEQSFKVARGHEEPYAVQFSVFLANRVGQLKDLMGVFPERSVEILGVSIVDSTDWAVVRIVSSDANAARALLQEHSLAFTESNVLLVELDGHAALSNICRHLVGAELNVNYAYPLTIRSNNHPVMVFHVDDHVMATQVLKSHGFTLIGHEDLRDPE